MTPQEIAELLKQARGVGIAALATWGVFLLKGSLVALVALWAGLGLVREGMTLYRGEAQDWRIERKDTRGVELEDRKAQRAHEIELLRVKAEQEREAERLRLEDKRARERLHLENERAKEKDGALQELDKARKEVAAWKQDAATNKAALAEYKTMYAEQVAKIASMFPPTTSEKARQEARWRVLCRQHGASWLDFNERWYADCLQRKRAETERNRADARDRVIINAAGSR